MGAAPGVVAVLAGVVVVARPRVAGVGAPDALASLEQVVLGSAPVGPH